MKNYIAPGESITLTAPYDVNAGDGVLVGSIFGFAQAPAATGEPVVLVRRGRFSHAKTSAQAWTEGAKIYWNNSTKVLTTAASGNTLVGAAAAAAADPSDEGEVLVDGTIR